MKPTTIRKRWRLACAALVTATLATCASLNAQTVPPFVLVDLGGPAVAGSVKTNADGSLTITGGGGDIWNASDQCTYFYTTLTESEWSMQIKIDSDIVGGDATWAKCEVMCRESNPTAGPAANDPFVAQMYTKPGGANWLIDQFRTAVGGNADWYHTNQPAYSPPVWIDLFRNGSLFSFYYSEDNVHWTDAIEIDTSTNAFTGNDGGTSFGTAWPLSVTAGIAVTSHDNSTSCHVEVSGLAVYFPQVPSVFYTSVPLKDFANYAGCEAAFSFATTNNGSPPQTYANATAYQWYKNGTALPGATGTDLTWLIDPSNPAENGAKIYCTAKIIPPYNTVLKSTYYSTTNTLTVLPGAVYYTNGVKLEFFANALRADIENDTEAPATWITYQQSFDNPGNIGINYTTRNSGWFIPPATDQYVFFVACDDDSDLFLSTDASMAKKTIIAQESGWSPFDSWLVAGSGAATDAAQKRSDQWTADASGNNPPNANGISLNKDQPYYIELVHHQGGGGDNFSVTYQTIAQIAAAGWSNNFQSSATLIAGTNGNIMLATLPAVQANFKLTQQPVDISATVGAGADFISQAVSDSELIPTYQWYRNGQPIATATGATYYLANLASTDSGSTFYVVASEDGLMSLTSSVVTLTVGAGIWEPGLALQQWWYGDNVTAANNLGILEAGQLGLPSIIVASPAVEGRAINNAGPQNDDGQIVCWVVPPATGAYTFYCNSDDAADLFLSSSSDPAGKQMIAQEVGWSNQRQWTTANGGNASQKCSDTFIPPGGTTTLHPNGITLVKNQRY